MTPQKALDKIAQLGHDLMLDPNPEVAHIGAAIMSFPIAASEDVDDFNELVHLIFMFMRVKMEQKEAIQKLLDPNED
jgi:hypothetical protein